MHEWQSFLTSTEIARTQKIALAIAERLRDPSGVVALAQHALAQSGYPSAEAWQTWSTSLSAALLFGYLDSCFPARGWDRVAHGHLLQGITAYGKRPYQPIYPGLYGGVTELAFTVHALSRNGQRYTAIQHQLDQQLLQFAAMEDYPSKSDGLGVAFYDYDTIFGPSGVGAYLLRRRDIPELDHYLGRIVTYLIDIANSENGAGPGFYIPPAKQATDRHRIQFPTGCVDLGLAHGIAGPVAFLSLTSATEWEDRRARQALRSLATWLIEQRCDDEWGPNWPAAVDRSTTPKTVKRSHAGWCYGSPGIAAALWLAGDVLGDDAIKQIALSAVLALTRRPVQLWGIPSGILCHGVAGLLQIVLRFAHWTGDERLHTFARELVAQLLELYDPQTLAGYRKVNDQGRWVDDLGFLEGGAGVALALLAASTTVEPTWDRRLLIA